MCNNVCCGSIFETKFVLYACEKTRIFTLHHDLVWVGACVRACGGENVWVRERGKSQSFLQFKVTWPDSFFPMFIKQHENSNTHSAVKQNHNIYCNESMIMVYGISGMFNKWKNPVNSQFENLWFFFLNALQLKYPYDPL